MSQKTEYEELVEKTKEWLESEEGRQKIKTALEEAQATKDPCSQGRRLPSTWRNRRINI